MTHDPHAVEAQHIEAHLEAMPSIAQILAFIQIAGPIIAQFPTWIKQIQEDLAALKAKP